MPKIFPIYLFTGDNTYLKKEAVRKLKKALLKKESEAFNFDTYDASKCDIKDVVTILYSVPFISSTRLVVLENVESISKDAFDVISSYIDKPSAHACLVLVTYKKDLPAALESAIKGKVREISFILPKGSRVLPWIQKEFKDRLKTINRDALELLRNIKYDDIEGLRNEIEKLVTYIGYRSTVTKKDVENIVGVSPNDNVFEFVHALSRKDAKSALSMAKDLLKSKKAVPEILGMVGWQFRRIKDAQSLLSAGATYKQAGEKFKVSHFYLERFIDEIKSFTPEEIDRNLTYLLETDYTIKKGVMKPDEALELFIVRVSR